jgi:secreted trypsin-like serine protease
MKVLKLLGFVSCALARSADQNIDNGAAPSVDEYPWQVEWQSGGAFSCGGVVVHASWILTAGHCVGNAANTYTAVVGNINRGAGTRVAVQAITRHPGYDVGAGFTPNDVAVVRADVPVNGRSIVAITTIDSGLVDRTAQLCWISGWGKGCGDLIGCPVADILEEADMPVLDNATCRTQHGISFNENVHICVYDGAQSACNGDSGGPLVCNDAGVNTLVGVTSWGRNGCPTNFPSVYTRLAAFHSFICQTTGNQVGKCT